MKKLMFVALVSVSFIAISCNKIGDVKPKKDCHKKAPADTAKVL